MSFRFQLIRPGAEPESIGRPVEDAGQAMACAQRLAIELSEERQDLLGKGCAVSVTDDSGKEFHREHIDSAQKHA
jgi:hypothetical protein